MYGFNVPIKCRFIGKVARSSAPPRRVPGASHLARGWLGPDAPGRATRRGPSTLTKSSLSLRSDHDHEAQCGNVSKFKNKGYGSVTAVDTSTWRHLRRTVCGVLDMHLMVSLSQLMHLH